MSESTKEGRVAPEKRVKTGYNYYNAVLYRVGKSFEILVLASVTGFIYSLILEYYRLEARLKGGFLSKGDFASPDRVLVLLQEYLSGAEHTFYSILVDVILAQVLIIAALVWVYLNFKSSMLLKPHAALKKDLGALSGLHLYLASVLLTVGSAVFIGGLLVFALTSPYGAVPVLIGGGLIYVMGVATLGVVAVRSLRVLGEKRLLGILALLAISLSVHIFEVVLGFRLSPLGFITQAAALALAYFRLTARMRRTIGETAMHEGRIISETLGE